MREQRFQSLLCSCIARGSCSDTMNIMAESERSLTCHLTIFNLLNSSLKAQSGFTYSLFWVFPSATLPFFRAVLLDDTELELVDNDCNRFHWISALQNLISVFWFGVWFFFRNCSHDYFHYIARAWKTLKVFSHGRE